jgi:superfamily II DNA or RNA helicase
VSADSLFDEVRGACSAAVWSRGVELVRAEAVSDESGAADEIALRVSTRGGLLSSRVVLYPERDDWECECASREAVCEHVAAALIALRRAGREGRPLGPAAGDVGRVGYRLARDPEGLALERVVAAGGGSHRLETTLGAIASGRAAGPRFVASSADLEIERTLGWHRSGTLPRGLLPRILEQLSSCSDVTLDGVPVTTSGERVVPEVRLEDDAQGFRLGLERHPGVTEVLAAGVVLCGDVLRLCGEPQLTGRELEDLTRGLHFDAGDVARLVTEILPDLSRRIRVDVRSRRLPRTVAAEPRIQLEVERRGEQLSVLPTLVYGEPVIARVDAGRLIVFGDAVPRRDVEAERSLTRRLQSALELLPGRRLDVGGAEAVELAERLGRWPGEIRGSAHRDFFRMPPLEPELRVGDAGFDLVFSAPAPGKAGGRRRADAGRVVRAWREGASLVGLSGGGFSPLPVEWLERFGERVADLLAARDGRGGLPRCALPDLARLSDDLGQPRPRAFEALRALLEERDGLPSAALPADLTATLRDYQRHGVDWLCALRDAGLGALLADDMGLGKTLQALCAVAGRTLVVAPTSVLPNWADEIRRFRPGLRCALYHGPERRLDPRADVTVTSYAVLRLDVESLAPVQWDTLVLDESQALKNPDSQVARAAGRLAPRFCLALTGTPVENRLDELWSQFHLLNRGLLGTRRDFEERYARPIQRGDAAATQRLRERIRPFVLRRLKREVARELPPRIEALLHAELTQEERDVYDAVRAATLPGVVERLDAGGGVLQALEALLRLRQAACHAALVPGQTARSSSKLAVLLEALEEVVAEDHKALVFSQWTSLLDLLEPHLRAAGLDFARLDGSTRDRAGVVQRFQQVDGPPLLIASLKAGGLGLNLTAADHVFILDPWWNPAVEDQAADRAHRIGQDRPVVVYRLVARDTVEERILALQERKRGLAEAALGAAERAGAITRDDLLALLA